MAHFRTVSPDGVSLPFVFESAQSASPNALVSLNFRNKDNDTRAVYNMASIDVYDSGAIAGNGLKDGFGTLAISTASNGEVSEVMRLTDDNFVGINTARPEANLHVVGTARFETSTFVSACAIKAPRTVSVGMAAVQSSATVHAWEHDGLSRFGVLARLTPASSSNLEYDVSVFNGDAVVASGTFSNLSWSNCALETACNARVGDILELRVDTKSGGLVTIASISLA